MEADDVRVLVEFNYWAKNRMILAVSELTEEQFLRDLSSSFPSIRDTLVHMMSAERRWLSVWQGISVDPLMPESFSDVASVTSCWETVEQDVRSFATTLTDVSRSVSVPRPDGEVAVFPLNQLMQHVVNHSSYHRGQVATLMRQMGTTPAKTDVVSYFGSLT